VVLLPKVLVGKVLAKVLLSMPMVGSPDDTGMMGICEGREDW
jgi:hypothetical protein